MTAGRSRASNGSGLRSAWKEVGHHTVIGQVSATAHFFCCPTENLYVVNSHEAITSKIARGLDPLINLDVRVTSIESQQEESQDPRLRVTAMHEGAEQVHEFDEVIVAVPMGCLKRDAIAFTPRLPDNIRTAVSNASISSLEKVYLAFPEAFWDRSSRSDDDTNTAADKGETMSLPGFANFLNPTVYAPPEHRSWCLELNPLSNPEDFGDHAQPALLFSLFGNCGRELTSQLSNLSPTSPEYFDAIVHFLQPYYSRLPNCSPDNPSCKPTAALATNWQNDEYAYGSYTNFQVHSLGRKVELDDEVRAMRHGMPERGLWFAGEHVAPFVGLGTSTGAYWSGEIAAMRVLGANGLAEDVKEAQGGGGD